MHMSVTLGVVLLLVFKYGVGIDRKVCFGR